MVALPKERCFWPAKSRKKLTFSRCTQLSDLVLKNCFDIFEGKWIQLPFIFAVLVKVVAAVVGKSVFHLWVTFQVEVFSYCTLTETFENGFLENENRFYLENVNFGSFGRNISRLVSVMFEWTDFSKKCAILVLF